MDFFFVVLYFSFPIIVIMMMEKARMGILQVSIPSFVILSMFAFAYVGALPLYFGWDHYRYEVGVQDKVLVLKMFTYSSWAILTMAMGFVFSKYIIGLKSASQINASLPLLKKSELFALCIILLLCFGVLYLYLQKVPSIALFVAIKKGASEGAAARSLMGNDFPGKYHRYSFFFHTLLNLITFTLFANWLGKKWSFSFFIFLIAFLGASFTAIMTTEKGPIAYLLISLFLVYILVEHNGEIPLLSLVHLIVVLMLPLSVLYIFFMGEGSILISIKSILSRVLSGGLHAAYYYLEYFPEHGEFLMGTFFPNPGGLLPFEPFPLTRFIHDWAFPEIAAKGISGSSPAVFWAGMYANFGLFGVIFTPFFIGVLLYTINFFILKLGNSSFRIGLLAWAAIHYSKLAGTDVGSFVFDTRMIGAVGVIIIVMLLTNRGKLRIA